MNEKTIAERLMEITIELTDLDSKISNLHRKAYELELERKKIVKNEVASRCGVPDWLLK